MTGSNLVHEKVQEIIDEMKLTGLWSLHSHKLTTDHQLHQAASTQEFLEWLQFIYLPTLHTSAGNHSILHAKTYVAPQAARFFGSNIRMGKLLQLLIELDALI